MAIILLTVGQIKQMNKDDAEFSIGLVFLLQAGPSVELTGRLFFSISPFSGRHDHIGLHGDDVSYCRRRSHDTDDSRARRLLDCAFLRSIHRLSQRSQRRCFVAHREKSDDPEASEDFVPSGSFGVRRHSSDSHRSLDERSGLILSERHRVKNELSNVSNRFSTRL